MGGGFGGRAAEESVPNIQLHTRLLGASLRLLSEERRQLVMRGDFIRHFGEDMFISKPPNLFKFIPEISTYLGTFLEECQVDRKQQFTMMLAFMAITNQGLPVMTTSWRVTWFLNSEARQSHVAWLQDMFLQPDLDSLVDFSTSNQRRAQYTSLCVPE
jgi:DNA polymerase phi